MTLLAEPKAHKGNTVSDDRQPWDGGGLDEPDAVAVPLFCPRCSRERVSERDVGRGLCRVCGDSLQEQGYCPVCESYWCLPAGTDCPKHDIPTEEGRALVPEMQPGRSSVAWVTLQTFADTLASEGPRLRLEAEGIPTFVEGSRMGSRSMYHVATGGVKLQVPEPLAADARVLLSQTWSTPALEEDFDDAWEELAPDPGSSRRSIMKGAILLVLFGPLIVWLIGWLLGIEVRLNPRRPHQGE